MMKRFDDNIWGNDFFLNRCGDVRKEIYLLLSEYLSQNKILFEKVYIECISLIKASAKKIGNVDNANKRFRNQ